MNEGMKLRSLVGLEVVMHFKGCCAPRKLICYGIDSGFICLREKDDSAEPGWYSLDCVEAIAERRWPLPRAGDPTTEAVGPGLSTRRNRRNAMR